jgi:methyl-accepting chemotaxis protein
MTQPLPAGLPSSTGTPNPDTMRRTRQIKELLRLCDLLRADLDLNDVLQQIAASISTCTGFRALAINLLDENNKRLTTIAATGISDEDRRFLFEHTFPIDSLFSLTRPQFRVSQSFFIPHQQMRLLAETPFSVKSAETEANKEPYEPGHWHPEDNLIVPLQSMREQKLLGCLLLDDPDDGKVPTLESIEMVELFANKAAIAIDNARLFREREEERRTLEDSLAFLREDLEVLRGGDLRRHVRSTHKKLQPLVETINAVIDEINAIFKSMGSVTLAVNKQTEDTLQHSNQLIKGVETQNRQGQRISQTVADVANQMHTLGEHATLISQTVVEAVDVTIKAQGSVDRAVEGMGMVREATMQSARSMKTLSESGQEINETIMAMTDLTTRMHLLALNAAIEATRAGEQGQGFGIIAQEIRTLALHCSEAARKIGAYIRTIQHEATTVSENVEQSTQQVIMQTELVTQSSVALEAVSAVTEQLTNQAQEMNKMAEGQARSSKLAANTLNDFLRTKNALAEHVQEMQQSMGRLVELSNALRSRTTVVPSRER